MTKQDKAKQPKKKKRRSQDLTIAVMIMQSLEGFWDNTPSFPLEVR